MHIYKRITKALSRLYGCADNIGCSQNPEDWFYHIEAHAIVGFLCWVSVSGPRPGPGIVMWSFVPISICQLPRIGRER